MKTIRLASFMGLTTVLIFSSCSMDKKVYSSGYHIEWNHKDNNPDKTTSVQYASTEKEQANIKIEKVAPPSISDVSETNADDNLTASLDKSIFIPQSKTISFTTATAKTPIEKAARAKVTEAKSVSKLKAIAKQEKKENKKASALKRKAAAAGGGGKSQLVALLLCIFLGFLGIHRFYLGYTGLGIMYLLFALIGIPLSAILIGLPLVIALAVLVLIDLIRIIIGSLKPKHGEYADKF